MLQAYKNRKIAGFTLLETIIGFTIFAVVVGIFARWFFMNRKYQETIRKVSEAQQNIRRASWDMVQELRIARTVLYPTADAEDKNDVVIKSDTKLVFKAFDGKIVAYYLSKKDDEKTGNILRCVIEGDGSGTPAVDPKPMAKNVDNVMFTAADGANHYVGIYIESQGVFSVEGVYLMNE